MSKSKQTGGEVIKDFLEVYEVPYVFGNPGTTETVILEAISHCKSTQYILALQESSVIGIAAGYALIKGKPSVVNIHTYPGLANSMCNMYNAYCSGIPMLVIAGQQNRKSLIHDPVLSGPLTQLAETATKYRYEVMSADDLAIALQRCYVQSMLLPSGPTFLSIPMDILEEGTEIAYFKKPMVYQSSIDRKAIEHLCELLSKTEKGKLAFIVDYEAGSSNSNDLIDAVASHFNAHLYASPFHVHPVLNPLSSVYSRTLPVLSAEIHQILSQYKTIVVFGAKVDTFLFTGKPAIPADVQLIQIGAAQHLAFDYPCDLAISSDIQGTLSAIIDELKIKIPKYELPNSKLVCEELMKNQGSSNGFGPVIIKILEYVDKSTSLITEGSSEDAVIQNAAAKFGFPNVYFSPRGGGLGWAMPLGTGISLATSRHSICFVGDGGSMYAIHTIWTAAKYHIPVIFICFINHEYRILKDLWCSFKKTDYATTHFIGLDLDNPEIDILSIAQSFGAAVATIRNSEDINKVLEEAFNHQGPTFVAVAAL